ncbi:MAG: thiamine pyrophosphate-binding protein [Sandaracinaceae bacterium]|nr:thiamine pyrophosphate-binding protein [Sandaracinaceae bacterium]
MATFENGGAIVADALARAGVRHLYTLCGGHISPILVGAKARGIRVVDVRDEAHAVFAADATARMTGIPGVAAVTAGPGVTNAMTAIKNAQMAQSPVLIFGGATATILKGRGSLQDIDQLSIMKPVTKWAAAISTVPALGPTVQKAIEVAQSGIPGPVFLEVPVDLLYPEATVRDWYVKESGVDKMKGVAGKAVGLYLKGHLYRQFHQPHVQLDLPVPDLDRVGFAALKDRDGQLDEVARELRRAERPVLVIGNQTMVNCKDPEALAGAVRQLGVPTFLGGSARGLLGRSCPIQFRHNRSKALKDADLVIIAGFPFDFRLKYGMGIPKKGKIVAANLSATELRKNRRPEIAVQMHAGDFLMRLAEKFGTGDFAEWVSTLKVAEDERDAQIARDAKSTGPMVDPMHFFLRMEEKMADDSILVADGGDFVATGAYILRPRSPLSWLDPGVFGTLGVGGGFAVASSIVRPEAETWLVWGDGSSAYSLSEIDTCVRHGLAPICVIGTDASWAQIARDQITILGDDVGTCLLRTAYHKVAEGYGGVGLLLDDPAKTDEVLDEAKHHSKNGKPVVVNVHLAQSDFRKGSISI